MILLNDSERNPIESIQIFSRVYIYNTINTLYELQVSKISVREL